MHNSTNTLLCIHKYSRWRFYKRNYENIKRAKILENSFYTIISSDFNAEIGEKQLHDTEYIGNPETTEELCYSVILTKKNYIARILSIGKKCKVNGFGVAQIAK